MSGMDDERFIMRVIDLKTKFLEDLQSLYPAQEIEGMFNMLLREWLEVKPFQLAANPDLRVEENKLKEFKNALSQLQAYVPIQYIIGYTYFYEGEFVVNSSVLIPRPETEELVDWMIQSMPLKELSILDVGTGSGCIGISLARKRKKDTIFAVDVSKEALKLAEQNNSRNGTQVTFLQYDLLDRSSTRNLGCFDIVVSNPPYVRKLEKKEIRENVIGKEPDLALFVSNEDPLIFYRIIAEESKKSWLQKSGWLYFEINQYLGVETVTLLQNLGFEKIELKKDLYGNDRMLRAYWRGVVK